MNPPLHQLNQRKYLTRIKLMNNIRIKKNKLSTAHVFARKSEYAIFKLQSLEVSTEAHRSPQPARVWAFQLCTPLEIEREHGTLQENRKRLSFQNIKLVEKRDCVRDF